MATVRSFRDLEVWKKAMALTERIYQATAAFPREERYGLTSQIRRATVSIPSNIAEGQCRNSTGEFLQFLGHARGSLAEVMTQAELAGRLGFLRVDILEKVIDLTTEVSKMLSGLMRTLRSKV
jgi:four helix bundle protein